jgi:hypothetical protein
MDNSVMINAMIQEQVYQISWCEVTNRGERPKEADL